jgi:hypothetical protein
MRERIVMGQYYQPLISKDNKNYIRLSPFDYGNTSKLLGHSWIGNQFVGVVMEYLHHNPCHLAWVGDYSNDTKNYTTKISATLEKRLWAKVWSEKSTLENTTGLPVFKGAKGFVVNHTQKQYVDYAKYAKNPELLYKQRDDMRIHFLPLLTAIGNGQGGGDYYNDNPNFKDIGSWAWDVISIEDEAPKGYTEIEPFFKENGY